jgi:hypothetical protein
MKPEWKTTKCDVCNKGFTSESAFEDAHRFHEPDCPNCGRDRWDVKTCDCDHITHPKCCPECNPYSAWALENNYRLSLDIMHGG